MNIAQLQELIYSAGIVGAGGAGFPTHKKFSENVRQIVVNAAECEPLMMVDHHILATHFRSSMDTLNDLIDILGAEEAIIGIKGKNMHLLDPEIVRGLEGTRIRIKEIPTCILPEMKSYWYMKQRQNYSRRQYSSDGRRYGHQF